MFRKYVKNNPLNIVEEPKMGQKMSFPMPIPEDYMIEEMLEIEGEGDKIGAHFVNQECLVKERLASWRGLPSWRKNGLDHPT